MSDTQLRAFLMRRLSEADTARLEDSILLEDGFAERLCNEEFDLLDDYAASRLDAEDAAAVERHLLTSLESRQSLRVARALQEVGKPTRAQRGPAVVPPPVSRRRRTPRVWGFVALLAACIAFVAYLPPWHSLGALESAPIISLMADVNRGPRPVLAIPPGSDSIRLQTEVPEPTTGARYSLTIRDSAGRQMFAAAALEVHMAGQYRFVEARVPAAALAPGDRTVALTEPGVAAHANTKFTWLVTGVTQ